MVFKLGAILFLFSIVTSGRSAEIPSFLHVCRRYDPKLSQCLVAAVEGLRPFLATGVPEYSIPSIEPLHLEDLTTETIGINFTATDVKAYGTSEFFVRKVKAYIDKQLFEVDIDVPRLKIVSNFTMTGQFLVLPLNGSGEMDVDIKNCQAKIMLKAQLYEKYGQKYLHFEDSETKIKYRKGFVDFGDVFGRDTLINFVLNDTANKNFEDFAKELVPLIEESLSSSVLNMSNKIVENFTYKQLFPH